MASKSNTIKQPSLDKVAIPLEDPTMQSSKDVAYLKDKFGMYKQPNWLIHPITTHFSLIRIYFDIKAELRLFGEKQCFTTE